jgi:hypothetical protein
MPRPVRLNTPAKSPGRVDKNAGTTRSWYAGRGKMLENPPVEKFVPCSGLRPAVPPTDVTWSHQTSGRDRAMKARTVRTRRWERRHEGVVVALARLVVVAAHAAVSRRIQERHAPRSHRHQARADLPIVRVRRVLFVPAVRVRNHAGRVGERCEVARRVQGLGDEILDRYARTAHGNKSRRDADESCATSATAVRINWVASTYYGLCVEI